MARPAGNSLKYMKGIMSLCRNHPPILTAARWLAADPVFAQAVMPQGEGTRVAEAFVVPLIVQSVLQTLWLQDGVPINDRELEKLTGVPRIGEAFLASGFCQRDAYGFYDLSRLTGMIPTLTFSLQARNRDYHQRLKLAAKALGYQYDQKRPGRVRAFKRWAETQGNNTTQLLARLLQPKGIHATTEKAQGDRHPRRRRKAEKGGGTGTAPPAGDGAQEASESPLAGP